MPLTHSCSHLMLQARCNTRASTKNIYIYIYTPYIQGRIIPSFFLVYIYIYIYGVWNRKDPAKDSNNIFLPWLAAGAYFLSYDVLYQPFMYTKPCTLGLSFAPLAYVL